MRMIQLPFTTQVQRRAFTLIEMLVYMALLTLVAGGALSLLFAFSDNLATMRVERSLTSTAETAFERMLFDIRQAESVNTLYSTLTTTPGVLRLTIGTDEVEYAVAGGRLTVSENGASPLYLTSEAVTVDEFRLYRYDNSKTEMVRAHITLSGVWGAASSTRSYELGAVLRGSYE